MDFEDLIWTVVTEEKIGMVDFLHIVRQARFKAELLRELVDVIGRIGGCSDYFKWWKTGFRFILVQRVARGKYDVQ